MRRAAPRMAAFGALAGALMLMGGPALASTGTGAQNPALTVTLTVGTFGVEVEYVDDHGQRARSHSDAWVGCMVRSTPASSSALSASAGAPRHGRPGTAAARRPPRPAGWPSATARRSPRPRRPPCPPGPPAPAGCRSGGPSAGDPVVPGPGCRPPRPWRHRSHWWPPPPASGRERWSRINCSIHGFQGILHDQARPVAAYSQPVGLAGRRSVMTSPMVAEPSAKASAKTAPSTSTPSVSGRVRARVTARPPAQQPKVASHNDQASAVLLRGCTVFVSSSAAVGRGTT